MSQPYEGDSNLTSTPGLTGSNTASGIGVRGVSAFGEAVHGETSSTNFAAVAGYELNPRSNIAAVYGEQRGGGPGVFGIAKFNGSGVFGTSAAGEGVHGETNAANHAAVAGFNNATAAGPAWGVWGSSEVGEGVHGETNSTNFAAVAGIELNPSSNVAAVYGEQRGGGPGVFGIAKGDGGGVFGTSVAGEGVHGETNAANHAAVAGFNNATAAGPAWGVWGKSQVGEGVHGETNSPTSAAVAGYALGTGPAGFFEGNVLVTGDVQLTGCDCAEQFDVTAAVACEPGTVMVLGDDGPLEPSKSSYDRRVAGVISGAAGFHPGVILDTRGPLPNRKPIALVGKVYCKVDATYGPIAVGDLLTTSPTPGHAMKAENPLRAFGAVLGKALRPLAEGQGLVPILIALQ